MIIHCLTCGKSTSSKLLACPYCKAEVTETTLQANGIELRERVPTERVKVSFLQALVHR